MAPPSPRISPERSAEKGRQVSLLMTRIASHAFRLPRKSGASLPPVIAMGASPERTMRKA